MATNLNTVARANLRSSKGKYVLTGIGISISAFFLAAVIVLTGTLQKSMDASMGGIATKIDNAVISAATSDQQSETKSFSLTADSIKKVQEDPSVEAYWTMYAAPGKYGTGDDKVKATYSQAPSKPELFPFPLEGKMPTNDSEMAISQSFAEQHNLKVGSKVTSQDAVQALNGFTDKEKEYTITGIFETSLATQGMSDFLLIGGTSVGEGILNATKNASSDPAAGMSAAGAQMIYLDFKGNDDAAAREALKKKLDTGDNSTKPDVVSGGKLLDIMKKQTASITRFLNLFIGAFAVLAILVSSFVISNTFAVLIGQRIRELALLRTLGARGGSLVRMIVTEAVFVGLIFSAIGAGLVYPVAALVGGMAKNFIIDYNPMAFIVGVIACTIVTVLASLAPAFTALRISPISAMSATTNLAIKKPSIIGLIAGVGAAALCVVLAMSAFDMASGSNKNDQGAIMNGLLACGALGVAIFLLAPWILLPLVRLFGMLFRSQTGKLALANSLRVPKRTVSTGRAVLVGVMLVAASLSAYTMSTETSVKAMEKEFPVSAMAPFSNNMQEGSESVKKAEEVAKRVKDLKNVEGVAVASAAGTVEYKTKPKGQDNTVEQNNNLVALSNDDLKKVIPLEETKPADNEVLVPKALWDSGSFNDSTRLKAKGPKGEVELKPVKSTSKQMLLIVNPSTGEKLQDAKKPMPLLPQGAQMPGAGGENAQAAQQPGENGAPQEQQSAEGADNERAAKEQAAQQAQAAGGGALGNQTMVLVHAKSQLSSEENNKLQAELSKANDGDEFTGGLQLRKLNEQVNGILLGMILVMLGLAAVISVIGIANTMTLSVSERRRENSMLRSLGLSRKQLRRMISLEAILITLSAVLVSIATGVGIAVLIMSVIADVSNFEKVFNLPYGQLLIIMVCGMIAALAAAAIPAARSSRLSPIAGLRAHQ